MSGLSPVGVGATIVQGPGGAQFGAGTYITLRFGTSLSLTDYGRGVLGIDTNAGGVSVLVENQGGAAFAATTLNFTGTGVTATDMGAGLTNVSIPLTVPGGAVTQIQYYGAGGVFAGSANFSWDNVGRGINLNTLGAGNVAADGGIRFPNDAGNALTSLATDGVTTLVAIDIANEIGGDNLYIGGPRTLALANCHAITSLVGQTIELLCQNSQAQFELTAGECNVYLGVALTRVFHSTSTGVDINGRLDMQAGQRVKITNTAINYQVLATDYMVGCTAAPLTITMSAAPSNGDTCVVKDTTGVCSGANPITISGNGHNIDGAATLLLNTAYASATLTYNAASTRWSVV